MASSALANIGLDYNWDLGEDGWNVGMDNNLLKLDVLSQPTVISATTVAEPASPVLGDAYIVPTSATGTNWAGQDGKVAIFDGTNWLFLTAKEGWKAWAKDQNQVYTFDTTWKLPGALYAQYADDTAAAAGSPAVPVGGVYINSTSKALVVRTV